MHVRAFGMMVTFSEYLLNDKDVINDVILWCVMLLPSVLFSRFVSLNELVVWMLLGEMRDVRLRSVWVIGNSPSALTFPGNAS